jgi:hypothetical protein
MLCHEYFIPFPSGFIWSNVVSGIDLAVSRPSLLRWIFTVINESSDVNQNISRFTNILKRNREFVKGLLAVA